MSQKKENKIGHIVLTILVGAFIGIGAILPGLSGGVMCVIFGIYRPLMETISHPFVGVKKHWRLLLPTCIGIVIGFVGFAGVLDWLLSKDALLMQSIFLGLLLGTLPSLWKEAGETKRTGASWLTLVVMFVVMVLVLSFLADEESTQMAKLINGILPQANFAVSANFGGFVIVGVCFALSIVMPGMSFSSPLMCLGLFKPMTENFSALAKLDLSVIPSFVIPVGLGALATVIIFAKPMNYLFEKKTSIGYHLVMGAVFASTLLLVPIKFDGAMHAVWCLAGLVGGAAAGYVLELVQGKIKAEKA
ncbi:MAG: DUF368 domain-containing protein [Clostridia bacterium]|nr:DUF368 domain-containing protein [Clostridia bacterium]